MARGAGRSPFREALGVAPAGDGVNPPPSYGTRPPPSYWSGVVSGLSGSPYPDGSSGGWSPMGAREQAVMDRWRMAMLGIGMMDTGSGGGGKTYEELREERDAKLRNEHLDRERRWGVGNIYVLDAMDNLGISQSDLLDNDYLKQLVTDMAKTLYEQDVASAAEGDENARKKLALYRSSVDTTGGPNAYIGPVF